MHDIESKSGERFLHDFKRDQESKFCFVCQESWPINETSVSKFNKCCVCDLSVHSGCRYIAKRCYPCEVGTVHKKLTSSDLQQVNYNGTVTVDLVHAYDLQISPGTYLYGVFKISSTHDTYKTENAAMGDHDCVWVSSQQSDGKADASSSLVINPSAGVDGPERPNRLRHKVHRYTDSGSVVAAPWVHLEIWKSYYGLFDGIVATCKVNMLPLLLNHDVTIERWFGLRDMDGHNSGMVLLRLAFTPDQIGLNDGTAGESLAVVPNHSTAITAGIDLGGEDKAMSVSRDSGRGFQQSPPLSPSSVDGGAGEDKLILSIAQEETLLSGRERSVAAVDGRSSPHEHSPIDTAGEGKDQLTTSTDGQLHSGQTSARARLSASKNAQEGGVGTTALSGGSGTSSTERAENSVSSVFGSFVTEDSSSAPGGQYMEGEHALEDGARSSGVRRRRVQTHRKDGHRAASGIPDDVDSGGVAGQGDDDAYDCQMKTKKPSAVESADAQAGISTGGSSNTSTSASAPNSDDQNPWRKWIAQTAEGIVKSASERGAAAVEIISSATTSASFRKRKRKDVGFGESNSTGGVTALSLGCSAGGVGTVFVNLISAYKSNVTDAADGNSFVVVSLSTGLPEYDLEQERETHVVESSATPHFNEKFQLVVPHFRSVLTLTLVDAVTDRKIGISEISIYAIQQRDADKYHSNWDLAKEEQFKIKDLSGKEVIGHFTAVIKFKENTEVLFLSSEPKVCMVGPEEAMSLERVRTHVSRFGRVISSIGAAFGRYRSLMDWENPAFTFTMLVLFVYFTLTIDAEYALCLPLFLAVALLSESWYHRHIGQFRAKWVKTEDDSLNYPYKPVAYLRLAVSGFRHFGHRGEPKTPPPYVRISLVPDGVANGRLNGDGTGGIGGIDDGGGTLLHGLHTEYHIATFSTFTGTTFKDLKDAQAASGISSVAGASGTSGIGKLISSLSLTKQDKTVKDALLHNVSDPWERSPEVMHYVDMKGILGGHRKDSVDISYIYPVLQGLYDAASAAEAAAVDNIDDSTNGPNAQGSVSSSNPSTKTASTSTKATRGGSGSNKSAKEKDLFVPWDKSTAVIKLTFHGDNPLSSFIDNTWGSVQVPLRDLVDGGTAHGGAHVMGLQHERIVWKDINWTTAHIQRLRNASHDAALYVDGLTDLDHHTSLLSHSFEYDQPSSPVNQKHSRTQSHGISRHDKSIPAAPDLSNHSNETAPQVLLRMQLDIKQSPKEPSSGDIEVSRVVQSLVTPRNEKSDSTISAIWNARDHIKYVQNILGGVLNKIESFKNVFNWTHPRKTFPIYAALFLLWIAAILIPGRYLILIAGLSEFLYKFMPQPEELPMSTRLHNLLESLPNDDDLSEVWCQIYREERESNRAVHEEKQRERIKQAKLRLVLDCQWDGIVKIKHASSASGHTGNTWIPAFLVVQGHRLVWWAKEADIDEGNAPAGELLLQGHAGTTHASPVDIKEVFLFSI